MSRLAGVWEARGAEPGAPLPPLDLAALGVKPGDLITIQSRRGKVSLYARSDDSSPHGSIFVAFCYYEAAINKLTNSALDPFGKIPEFKYCAVRISKGGTTPVEVRYGGAQILAPEPAVAEV